MIYERHNSDVEIAIKLGVDTCLLMSNIAINGKGFKNDYDVDSFAPTYVMRSYSELNWINHSFFLVLKTSDPKIL